MVDYYLESRTKLGEYVATLPAYNFQGEIFADKADQLRFSVSKYSPEVSKGVFEAGVHEAWLWRSDISFGPIFAGPVWDINVGSDDTALDCSALGLESYFTKRRVDWDLVFQGWDRVDILWDLIRRSQLLTEGDLGIVRGLNEMSGVLSNIKYNRDEGILISTVGEEFTALQDGGFVWKIDSPTRAFRTWSPQRDNGPANKTLEYGEFGSIQNYSVQYMGEYLGNDVLLNGPEGSFPTYAVDTTSRATYGLMQVTDQYDEARIQEDLTDRADFILQKRKRPKEVPTVVLNSDTIDPFDEDQVRMGERYRVIIDDGYVQYNKVMRCVGFQFTIGRQGQNSVNMYLNDLRELGDPE